MKPRMKQICCMAVAVLLSLSTAALPCRAVTLSLKADTPALAYVINLAFASKARTDQTALAYFLRPSHYVQSDDPAIIQMANRVTAGITGDYDKALAIHDWVCRNLYYDYDAHYKRKAYGPYSAVDALKSRVGVCEGYSNLTAAMLRAVGIPAKKVSGYVLSGEDDFPADALDGTGGVNHVWNEAFVNGRWIIIDATWDCTNRYEYGAYVRGQRGVKHQYFNADLKTFAENHVVMKSPDYDEIYLYIDYTQYWDGNTWLPLNSSGTAPILKAGSVFIPLRPVVEALGGAVTYIPPANGVPAKIVCQLNDYYTQLWMGHQTFYADKTACTFDTAPFLQTGTTMVQLRPLLTAMGCTVWWNGEADGWHGRIKIGFAQ